MHCTLQLVRGDSRHLLGTAPIITTNTLCTCRVWTWCSLWHFKQLSISGAVKSSGVRSRHTGVNMRGATALQAVLLLCCSIAATAAVGSNDAQKLPPAPARRPQPPPRQRRASKTRPPPPRPAPYVVVPVRLSGYTSVGQATSSAQVLSGLVRRWRSAGRWSLSWGARVRQKMGSPTCMVADSLPPRSPCQHCQLHKRVSPCSVCLAACLPAQLPACQPSH